MLSSRPIFLRETKTLLPNGSYYYFYGDDNIQKALSLPFFKNLYAGTLKQEAYKTFLSQDIFFLRAYVEIFKFAINAFPSSENALLISLYNSAKKMENCYLEELGSAPSSSSMMPATQAYVEHIYLNANSCKIENLVASVTGCYYFFRVLGNKLYSIEIAENPYKVFIEYCKNHIYSQNASRLIYFFNMCLLEEMLIYYGNPLISFSIESNELVKIFNTSLKYEYEFFKQIAS